MLFSFQIFLEGAPDSFEAKLTLDGALILRYRILLGFLVVNSDYWSWT